VDKIFGKPPDTPDDGSNITPTDLLELPHAQRQVMRIIFRYRQVAYGALIQYFETASESDRMAHEDLDSALLALIERKWVIVLDEGQTFKVGAIDRRGALNEDAPQAEQQKRRSSGRDRLNSFWDKVGARSDSPSEPPKPRSSLLDELAASAKRESDQGEFVVKRPRPPNRESKSGISKIFDELARKSDAEPQADPNAPQGASGAALEKGVSKLFDELASQPKPPGSGRISKLFDELARKDEGEGDEASKP
jgi:hypothetical protein